VITKEGKEILNTPKRPSAFFWSQRSKVSTQAYPLVTLQKKPPTKPLRDFWSEHRPQTTNHVHQKQGTTGEEEKCTAAQGPRAKGKEQEGLEATRLRRRSRDRRMRRWRSRAVCPAV
jgi:hypothetical protein